MKPQQKFISIGLVLTFALAWYFFSRQQPIHIPEADEVVSLSAAIYDPSNADAEVSEFTVPKSHYAKLLNLFRAAQPDPRPPKWRVLGSVKIKTEIGTTSISLFRTGESTEAFTTSQHRYYRGSTDESIIQAIAAAEADAK